MGIKADIQSLSPGAIIELFEIDATNFVGGTVSYFHAGTNAIRKPIVWRGITYSPLPIDASGFDINTKGTLPRPKLKVANVGGLFSALAAENDDLVGCKITRRRTMAKYLDIINWIDELGTAQAASPTSLTLASTASLDNDKLNGHTLRLMTGTASVQEQLITDYDGVTKIASVAAWPHNFLLRSNDMTHTAWVKSDVTITWDTAELASKVTTGLATNPFFSQTITLNPASRTFKFQVDIKAIGTAIGKTFQLSSNKVPYSDGLADTFTATGAWQRFTHPHTFDGTSATSCAFRIDPAQTSTGGVTGEQILVRYAQVTENVAINYIETTSAAIALPNSTTTYEVRHPLYATSFADPNQYLPDDIWYVEQKIIENRYVIEWELASIFDLQGVMLPYRQVIQDSCPWRYRGTECGYTGTAYFDLKDIPTTLAGDFCAKHLSSCKVRFPAQTLPFGGFPGAVRFAV